MKRLLITFIFMCMITTYPPSITDAKVIEAKKPLPAYNSIQNYEQLKHEILVNQFFRQFTELKHKINSTENNLK
jgi:hypothetical protein